ncbi:histone H3-like centromeric protein A [Ambystoma mexicanum]|uniref:histone H3-like centromeric protein A n=1 Tax=Ambystoma mexicanum TaxID=8296 RepID=UPI0037E7F8CF
MRMVASMRHKKSLPGWSASKRKARDPEKVPDHQQQPASQPSSPRPPLTSPRRRNPPARRSREAARMRRYRTGILARKVIRKYQKSTRLLMRRLPFFQLVREICAQYPGGFDFQWQSQALLALREATEAFMVLLLQDSYYCTLHAK